jgi:hypothetical protein
MRTRSVVAAGAAALALALAIAGCGGSSSSGTPAASGAAKTTTVAPNAPEVSPAGDIPDNQAYVAYSPPGAGYSVKVPEGWARTTAGGVTSFTDKLNRIQLQTLPAKAKQPAGKVTTVTRKAGKAIRITYEARSPADPVTGRSHADAVERYVFFHGGKDIVLTLSGPKGADNVDPWKIVTDSLRYTR